jgi:curved DNA-binding protein CbpA
MKTLYDLLGALPCDDAEGLRTAFRRAVKGAHPDIYPDDPDAALKFRQIVRANEILGDAEQREAYDHLLELARIEQESASKLAVAARIHKLASGVIALAGISIATVGGYLLFIHMSAASVTPFTGIDVAMHASAERAAVNPAGEPDTTDKSVLPAKNDSRVAPNEAIVPSAATAQNVAEGFQAVDAGPTPDLAASEARSLRARGMAAYRDGDLDGAIADLDQAIQLDPKFSAAYIDRGIIFYRLRRFDRAFADISRAKRIEKSGRTKSAPTAAVKPRFDQAGTAPLMAPPPRRRTAAQYSPLEGGFTSGRQRY